MSVLYNTDTLHSILALYVLPNLLMPFLNLLMPLFQPPDATFSIFQECQSCESEVLVWVSPNHSSSTRDLEKPILALPLHRIGPILTLSFLLSDLYDKFLYTFSHGRELLFFLEWANPVKRKC